jgi:PAS domain S-box-containing protein
MKPTPAKYVGIALITAAVYVAGAKMGLTLAFVAEQVTVVWPPTGIALCAVLLFGYRIWPAIALGAFLANITTNAPAIASLGIAAGNTLEALLGAYLLNRFVRFRPSLERFRDVFGLIVFGAFASTAVSATIGVMSLCVTHMQSWERFGSLWGVWFLGDAMGAVIVAPLGLTLLTAEARRRIRRRGLGEFVALIVVLTAIDLIIFAGRSPLGPYAIFPVLIWAALRFGPGAMALSGFITATIAVLGTIQGFGPFRAGSTNDNLISLELFMFVATATGFILAVEETKRESAESASHQSEDRYRSLVLASSQVVWSTNATGDVIEDLPTWRTFTGQTREEMMGRGWARKLHPDDIQRVSAVWERSLATGTPHEVEFRVLAADDTYRNVLGRAVPVLQRDGSIREWVGALTDITEKKKAEREMLEANQRKDEFLAMLAHELRNPLAPIRNAVEIIRSTKGERGRIDWACDVMERQIHHMSRLLDDLLDVARITYGQIELYRQPTDLATLVRRSLEAMRSVIEKKNLRIITDFVRGPVSIHVDVTRMEQVVTNLLNNAAKFTPPGGCIWVTVDRERDLAVLRVKDNGRGITRELLPKIFDLFVQADRSLARSEGGLGIGLTLVHNLVRMHSGEVFARSEGPNLGSEFIVRLPIFATVPEYREAKLESPAVYEQRKRVLVIEDNFDSAETLAAMVDVMGHEAHTAHDGPSGIEQYMRLNPEVVLLDIGLPGLSGFEVAQQLRSINSANGRVKIIALTGYGSAEDRERTKAAGFDHHLVKPVDFRMLERLLL